jgi:hypothetical protein
MRSKEGVAFNGKTITNMMLCLSKSGKSISANVHGNTLQGLECTVVPEVVSALWKEGQISVPRKDLFVCVNGKSLYLRCYKV